jgi:23S rRNA (cytidine1920-2'-O)/16S rRNA (cytidine1409-2'-O)-methyltransferase
LDVGASTGGFTQVLLELGAEKVHAIDVGHNQMDWKIRSDPRVVVIEGMNARYLQPGQLPGRFGVIVIDVSFISLEKILPALLPFAEPKTDWIALVKPQFEVGKEKVGKGGIVTDEAAREEAVERIIQMSENLGLLKSGLIKSPIRGTSGNQEYLLHLRAEK